MSNQRHPALKLPRGIRSILRTDRPCQFAIQWRVDGQRKTKAFKTREEQVIFARDLAGGVKREGLSAYRLNHNEAREWRAFRATIGAETNLDHVASCWAKHGGSVASLPLANAIAAFLEAKTAEGVRRLALVISGLS